MNLFKKEENNTDIDLKIVNQIKGLGLDIINNYGNGDEGVVLSSAGILYTLFSKHLNFNPKDPKYLNRDRLVITSPNMSALVYATMYMAGCSYSEEDLKNYGKNDLVTPIILHYNLENGIEITSGNIGCSLATSIGMAIGEEYLRNYFKAQDIDLINHYTYVLINDSDLMDGVSYEAVSLAGTLNLNKLIFIYDNSGTTVDGNVELTFTENVLERFKALGWNTVEVNNSEDITVIDKAISFAKDSDKPTLISVKTILGKFSKYENSNLIHEHILTSEEISEIKSKLELRDINFAISSELAQEFQKQINDRVLNDYEEFNKKLESIENKYLSKLSNNDLTINLGEILDITKADLITNYGSKVLNSIDDVLFMSSSCDNFKNCKSYLDNKGDFTKKNRLGQNIYGGSRNRLMASVNTGLTLSGIRNVTSTDIQYIDYMLSAIRFAASMNLPNVYIFTDSKYDLENYSSTNYLETVSGISNVEVFTPCDMNEVIGTFKTVFGKNGGVSVIFLASTSVSTKTGTSINDTSLGGYIVKEEEGIPCLNLVASGTDLDIALELEQRLLTKGIFMRVISMPSTERFDVQSLEYKFKVIDFNEKTFIFRESNIYNHLKYITDNLYILNKNTDNLDIDSLEIKIEELL